MGKELAGESGTGPGVHSFASQNKALPMSSPCFLQEQGREQGLQGLASRHGGLGCPVMMGASRGPRGEQALRSSPCQASPAGQEGQT